MTHHGAAAMLSVADYFCIASGFPGERGAVAVVSEDSWNASGVTAKAVPVILQKFFAGIPSIDEICQLAA